MTKALRSRVRSGPPWPSDLRPPTSSALDAWNAGARPERIAARSERASVNTTARPSSGSARSIGTGTEGSIETSASVITRASANPATPPARNNSVDSTSICRINRPRPAPIASRTASSRRRAVARASRTPATFAHAMASTSATSPISTAMNAATGAPSPGSGDEAATASPLPRLAAGNSVSSARPMLASSSRACVTETPGFRRAPITIHALSRLVSSVCRAESSPTMVSGTHRSPVSTVVPWKPSGVTPITVNGRPFNWSVCPTIPGSPLKRRIQKR